MLVSQKTHSEKALHNKRPKVKCDSVIPVLETLGKQAHKAHV